MMGGGGYFCHDRSCLGEDLMVFIGHITSDSAFDVLPEYSAWEVDPGLIQVINGTVTGTYTMDMIDDGGMTIVKSLLNGTYCTNLAAEPGAAIQDRFIEPDSVTVKQTVMLTDLDIAKEVDEASPTMGDMVKFTVTLENMGPSMGTSIFVMDMLPEVMGYDHYSASQGWYDVTSGYWSVGDLMAAETATLEIWAVVNTVGGVCNSASVASLNQHDPVTTNNMAEACLTAVAPPPAESATLSLDEGLNLISLPLMPDESDPAVALSGVSFGGSGLVGMYEGSSPTGCWASYDPNTDSYFGCTFTWADGYGYWMSDVDAGQSLVVMGEEMPAGAQLPPSYDVAGGWNLIGFKSTTAKLPSAYLAGIEGKYVMIYGYDNGAFYAVGSPGHAMLQPGYGYWLAIKVGESGTIFP
jgi:uncharacterized repeat protein (TIGR01451 family)